MPFWNGAPQNDDSFALLNGSLNAFFSWDARGGPWRGANSKIVNSGGSLLLESDECFALWRLRPNGIQSIGFGVGLLDSNPKPVGCEKL